MFVRVTVDPTEKIPTAATKTWKMTGQIVSLRERLCSHVLHDRSQNFEDAGSDLIKRVFICDVHTDANDQTSSS